MRYLIGLFFITSCFGQIRVNVGGPEYTDTEGQAWSADTGCTSNSEYTYTSTITGTSNPTLYQTGRTSTSSLNCTYNLVTNNYYVVTMKFAEYNRTYTNPKTPRLMNIIINGVQYYTAVNIFQMCGFASACDLTPAFIPVNDNGQISVTITQQQGQPMLSAISVMPVGELGLDASQISYLYPATGAVLTTVQKVLDQSVSVKDFGAKCDDPGNGTGTDDTNAFVAAFSALNGTGLALRVPGLCAVSTIPVTVTSASMICQDPQTTGLIRVSTALQASTPLLKFTNSTSSIVSGCKFDEQGNGTNYTNAAAEFFCTSCSNVIVTNNYFRYGQSLGILFDKVNNFIVSNNSCDHIWQACVAVGGGGTTSVPIYSTNGSVTNNQCTNMPYCVSVEVYVQDFVVANNTAVQAAYTIEQGTRHFVVSNNTYNGVNTYGNAVVTDAFFDEGSTNGKYIGNYIVNPTRYGIWLDGSQLTIAGTTVQLPESYMTAESNTINGASSIAIRLDARSFDSSQIGIQNTVKDNIILNTGTGIAIPTCDYCTVTGNNETNLQAGGDTYGIRHGTVTNNTFVNTGAASAGSYPAMFTTGSVTDLIVDNNIVKSTGSNSNSFCFQDAVYYNGGGTPVATSIQLGFGNIFLNCAPTQPAWTAAPTVGTYTARAVMNSFQNTAGSVLGWLYDGSAWQPIAYLNPDARYVQIANAQMTLTGTTNVPTITNNAVSGEMDFLKLVNGANTFGKFFRPSTSNNLEIDAYDGITLGINTLGGSGKTVGIPGIPSNTGGTGYGYICVDTGGLLYKALGCPSGTAPVTSFNTRTGAVTLTSGDVTGALTYTPAHNGVNTNSGTANITTSCSSASMSFPITITCTSTDSGHVHGQN